jgi:hypothetical protein
MNIPRPVKITFPTHILPAGIFRSNLLVQSAQTFWRQEVKWAAPRRECYHGDREAAGAIGWKQRLHPRK